MTAGSAPGSVVPGPQVSASFGMCPIATCGFLIPPIANMFCLSLAVGSRREVASVTTGRFQSGSLWSSSFFQSVLAVLWIATANTLLNKVVYSPCALEAHCVLPSTFSVLCTVDMRAACILAPSGLAKVRFGWKHLLPCSLVISSLWVQFGMSLILGMSHKEGLPCGWSGFSSPQGFFC